jgi:diketogulonate reductase-like aldo/keto reductase
MISLIARLVTSFPASSQPSSSGRSTVSMSAAAFAAQEQRPTIVYGTAWKKERTKELVLQALRLGYRAIDTACQPKHYQEELVGAALEEAEATGVVERSRVYVQTKYTPVAGQDPNRTPYDASAPLEEQVRTSVAVSLRNLRTSYVDCLVLHSPLPTHDDTMRVWRAMERHVESGEVRTLGVSNIYDPGALKALHEEATIKPSVVQNRFYPDTRHDGEVRAFCREKGIAYQSFWTLTGNKRIVEGRAVAAVAKAHDCTPSQAWLGFVRALGITPLTGTTSSEHMAHDLSLPTLSEAEVERLERLVS